MIQELASPVLGLEDQFADFSNCTPSPWLLCNIISIVFHGLCGIGNYYGKTCLLKKG